MKTLQTSCGYLLFLSSAQCRMWTEVMYSDSPATAELLEIKLCIPNSSLYFSIFLRISLIFFKQSSHFLEYLTDSIFLFLQITWCCYSRHKILKHNYVKWWKEISCSFQFLYQLHSFLSKHFRIL